MTLEVDANGQKATLVGGGLSDFANGTQSLTLTLPDGSTIEMVAVATTMYLRTPTSGGWVQIDVVGELADEAVAAAGGQDPLKALDQLRTVSDLEAVGEEDVRGMPLTRYHGTLDVGALIEQIGLPPEQVEAFDQAVEDGDFVVTSTIDAFADAEGFVHRVVTQFAVEDLVDATTTVDILDIGVPVQITVPAPEEIVRTEQAGTRQELYTLMQSLAG